MQWTELLPKMINEYFNTADGLMNLVSDDELDWKPASGDNWMSMGQLLGHLTNSCGFCCRAFDTGDWSQPEGETEGLPPVASVAEARRLLAEDRSLALSVVENAGEKRLQEELSNAPWEPDQQRCLGPHCMNMVLHLDSHRHQLFSYHKLMGKEVNTMHLWGL